MRVIASRLGFRIYLKTTLGSIPRLQAGEGVLDTGACLFGDRKLLKANEIRLIVTDMKHGKSPGHDSLSIEHLQHTMSTCNMVAFAKSTSHAY